MNVNPRYGTLEDWDRLLKGCHDRGMKLMMDLVVNHTSDEVYSRPIILLNLNKSPRDTIVALLVPRIPGRRQKLNQQPETRLVYLAPSDI